MYEYMINDECHTSSHMDYNDLAYFRDSDIVFAWCCYSLENSSWFVGDLDMLSYETYEIGLNAPLNKYE